MIKPLPGTAAVLASRAARALATGNTPLPPSAYPPIEEDPAVDAGGVEATYLMRTDFGGTLPGENSTLCWAFLCDSGKPLGREKIVPLKHLWQRAL